MSSRTYRSTLVGVTALFGVAAGIPAATVEAKPQRPKLVTVSMTASSSSLSMTRSGRFARMLLPAM